MSGSPNDTHRRNGRGGFTLIELAVVTVVIGILSSVAVPVLHSGILKADAARLVSDAHNVSLATQEFLAENGRFPTTAAAGTFPPELAGFLPEGFPFMYKDVTYRWVSVTYPDKNNSWNTRHLGVLLFDFSARADMAQPLASFAGGDAYWTPTAFYFVYRG